METQQNTVYELFKADRVTDVKTVAEFLDRYYRHDRYKGRGDEYAAILLKHHEEDFKKLGVDWISKYDSVTGDIVAFYGSANLDKRDREG